MFFKTVTPEKLSAFHDSQSFQLQNERKAKNNIAVQLNKRYDLRQVLNDKKMLMKTKTTAL